MNDSKECDREKALYHLHEEICCGVDAKEALWQAIVAYQGCQLYTTSGLPFQYVVKRKRNGELSGELVVNRKEGSKTLTKSSIMLAFDKVMAEVRLEAIPGKEGTGSHTLIPPLFKGPKAVGQIFGISYLYSLFWKLGLIAVPERVEEKLKGSTVESTGNSSCNCLGDALEQLPAVNRREEGK